MTDIMMIFEKMEQLCEAYEDARRADELNGSEFAKPLLANLKQLQYSSYIQYV